MIRLVLIAALITVVVTGVAMLYSRALRLAADPERAAALPAGQKRLAAAAATLGGLGRLPAPGTWGSAAAIPLAWALHGLGGFPLMALGTAVAFLGGLWATAAHAPQGDPPEVIVDEVAGMLLALWPLSLGLWLGGAAAWVFPWPGWVLGFVAFRALDIWKPWPVSRVDAMPGPWGVMLDDVAAGVLAAAAGALAAAVAHGAL